MGRGTPIWKPCAIVDVAAPQPIRHVLIGDEFRHGFFPQALGDPDDRFNDELVGGICAEAADEVAIDLEIVEGEMLQVIERPETDAKIVQREPATPTPQLRGELLRVVDVANRRRFGQLEDQTRGVDAPVRERSIDDRDELRAEERPSSRKATPLTMSCASKRAG